MSSALAAWITGIIDGILDGSGSKDWVITVINPWGSSVDIKIDYDTSLKAFEGLYYTGLPDNNPKQSCTERLY